MDPINRPKKFLIVCAHNLCRSVIVAEILKERLAKLPNFKDSTVDTCGCYFNMKSGLPADPETIKALNRAGYTKSIEHKSKNITRELVDWADLIWVMVPHHNFGADVILKIDVLNIYDPDGISVDIYDKLVKDSESTVDRKM